MILKKEHLIKIDTLLIIDNKCYQRQIKQLFNIVFHYLICIIEFCSINCTKGLLKSHRTYKLRLFILGVVYKHIHLRKSKIL